MTDTCGWLIGGDPNRPCMRKPGHKDSRHHDAAQLNIRRVQAASFREANLELTRKRTREAQRNYYRENRKTIREYYKSWYAQNPETARQGGRRRRARQRQVPHVDWTRQQLLELYGAFCYLCKQPLPSDWHAEHVIPVSRGGWDVPVNLRPACPACNLRKSARLPPMILQMKIWYELREYLEPEEGLTLRDHREVTEN
jgi:5-methylcytosine-specific restriction endonuclease McrA